MSVAGVLPRLSDLLVICRCPLQVFYPAYLTYLQQKNPDEYDQKRVFLEKYTDPKRIMKTDRGRGGVLARLSVSVFVTVNRSRGV